ncbi:MAG: hypothetical protein FWB95_04600 [Treponema sp.]|nr:hypothetical protein [Treponema sp.]
MIGILRVPAGMFAADDEAAARKRREIAERLKKGQEVSVTNTGEVVTPNDPKADGDSSLAIPPGKLAASFYWYERDPELFEAERTVMKMKQPGFKLEKLDDGRLCWIGEVNPRGSNGGTWTLQVIYDHNHPHNDTFGGSIKVYSIKPTLEDLIKELGELPHILRDTAGYLHICTARAADVNVGRVQTSAATCIGWAVKWIWMVEAWMHGEFGKEIFDHDYI